MVMDKYGCLMQMYVYYYLKLVNIEHKDYRYVSKVIDVFHRTCSRLLDAYLNNSPFTPETL